MIVFFFIKIKISIKSSLISRFLCHFYTGTSKQFWKLGDPYSVVELPQKRKGVFFMVKRKRKGVLSLSCGTRDRGGGCKSKFSKPQMPFFPFVRNSRPGGGCKWNENSFEIFSKFQCLRKFVLTNERFRRAQAKNSVNFRENAQTSPRIRERGPFTMGKGSFRYGKGVLSVWERGPFKGPPVAFFLS